MKRTRAQLFIWSARENHPLLALCSGAQNLLWLDSHDIIRLRAHSHWLRVMSCFRRRIHGAWTPPLAPCDWPSSVVSLSLFTVYITLLFCLFKKDSLSLNLILLFENTNQLQGIWCLCVFLKKKGSKGISCSSLKFNHLSICLLFIWGHSLSWINL